MAVRKINSRSIGVDVIAAEDLAANSVTVSEISDGAVTSPKLASGAAVANIGYTPVNKAGDTMTGNLVVGNSAWSDTGLGVRFGSSAEYGRIRFYQGNSATSDYAIHSFGSAWGSPLNLWSQSTGAINVSGLTGVTLGPWNDPVLAADNAGTVKVKTTLNVGSTLTVGNYNVLSENAGTNIATLQSFPVNMTANTPYALARIMTIGSGVTGIWAIIIYMGDGGPHGGGTHYWNATYAGTIAINNSNTAYNATGPITLKLNSHYHHITTGEPTFTLDSDNSGAAYGNTNLYITVPVDTRWYGATIYVKKIMG